MAAAASPMTAVDPGGAPSWIALVEAAQAAQLAAVRAGQAIDHTAFSQLHREFGAMVHGLLLARVDPTTADDLTQDVFLIAWQRIDRLHDPRAWPAWLSTIARNRALDHIRAQRHANSLPGTLPNIATNAPDPAMRTEAERLLATIRELPDALVEPLILRLIEGFTGPEIAERTGLSPGYVRVNLHRGMKLLRHRLED